MYPVTREAAMRDKMAHMFIPGRGYIYVGRHPMPAKPACAAHECTAPVPTSSGTWHLLSAPTGADVKMQWVDGEWLPILGKGNRVGFKPDYLAAHGWRYKGPVA